VPVVPVYIEGLRNVMPKGERVPRPAAVSVRIGAPVWLDDATSVPQATERLQHALLSLEGDSASEAAAAARPDPAIAA
jgi:1-acyl-sn-glycerol-3-phosphate acyltransferase